MLDYVGLISADNEELIPFVWEAFTDWKFAPKSHARRQAAYDSLRISRETMCRPIERVHFLGLFDTVNSVAEFEVEAGGDNVDRSGCQPRPTITRHAVSVDERRIKFQPVLFGNEVGVKRRKPIRYDQPEEAYSADSDAEEDHAPPDLKEVYFAGDHSDVGGGWRPLEEEEYPTSHIPLTWMVNEAMRAGLTFNKEKIGPVSIRSNPSESASSSSSSLPSASCAAIHPPSVTTNTTTNTNATPAPLQKAQRSQIHDSLDYDSGKGLTTFFWRMLEYLPLKRPIVQPDGTIVHSRWHTRGLRRPLPHRALVHGSVVRRLRWDPDYRPYNLGLGYKPNMQDRKEEDRDIGQWKCVHEDEDEIREYWVKD